MYELVSGVPIKLLHEGEGHIITVELKNGEIYRGQLVEAEETMNCQLKEGKAHLISHLNPAHPLVFSHLYC
jgi:small nuclear ribonucleoprotein (snRNP)-like protein